MTTAPLRLALLLTLLLTLGACSPDPDDPQPMSDASMQAPDLSTQEDSGADEPDASAADAATDLPDAAPDDMAPDLDEQDLSSADSGGQQEMGGEEDMTLEDMDPTEDMADPDQGPSSMPLPGFGALSGDCQQLDIELDVPQPALFRNTLDFMNDPYDMTDYMLLSMGAQRMIDEGNAGGNSVLSEVFAFEVLHRCESAALLKTETKIAYSNPMGKITDILVEIDGKKVGVSVVRAIAFPFDQPYPASEAERILEKKLGDIPLSTANVEPADAWVKQILSVIAYTPQHADQIEAVYQTLDSSLKGDTILYITVMEGSDGPVFGM